ncbi:MAG: hypothetical protein CL920_37280 [Deltaproteobacteria bacterium]|nr:hypothetical protein [Deltaproteobacteria bacterium]MBU54385.1 hypothetical protein [Deltaproteobacteria bacterium]
MSSKSPSRPQKLLKTRVFAHPKPSEQHPTQKNHVQSHQKQPRRLQNIFFFALLSYQRIKKSISSVPSNSEAFK